MLSNMSHSCQLTHVHTLDMAELADVVAERCFLLPIFFCYNQLLFAIAVNGWFLSAVAITYLCSLKLPLPIMYE